MKMFGWLIIMGTLLTNAICYFHNYIPEGRTVTKIDIESMPAQSNGWTQSERQCIARVVYNESRNQSRAGQIAVAATLLNRSLSSKFSRTDVCDLAKQRGQYSYRVKPNPKNSIDRAALVKANEISEYVTSNYGALSTEIRSFLYFNSHPPRRGFTTIGDHKFYG